MTTTTLSQGADLTPRQDFAFKVNGKGRTIRFKAGSRLWVASSRTEQSSMGTIEVCRSTQPKGFGYHFTPEQIEELFVVA